MMSFADAVQGNFTGPYRKPLNSSGFLYQPGSKFINKGTPTVSLSKKNAEFMFDGSMGGNTHRSISIL